MNNPVVRLTLAALLIASCALPKGAYGQSGLDPSATALITVACRDRSTGAIAEGSGTGFVIERSGYVLTSFHVVSCHDRENKKQLQLFELSVRLGSPFERDVHTAQVRMLDDRSDIAILKIVGSPRSYNALKMCSLRNPSPEMELVAAGFPEGRGYQPVGVIFGNAEADGGKWSVAAPFGPGMSGGPVARNGFVVGIVAGGFKNLDAARTVLPIYRAASLIESETGIDIPSCKETAVQPNDGRCRTMEKPIPKPIEVRAGDCFVSPDGKSKGYINVILTDAVRFTDAGSNKHTCFAGEACSFGWEDAPKFVFIFDNPGGRVELAEFRH